MEYKFLVKRLLVRLLPPVVVDVAHRFSAGAGPEAIKFTGDYLSWEEAELASTGYSTPEILVKTRASMLKVKNGEAAFERDSVLFYEKKYPFPLLAGLLRVAAKQGHLSVLDFGGALGSTYFQCLDFLSEITDLRWSIVEQLAQVVCGQNEFTNNQLHFYNTITDCLVVERPNVLLLSGVIQCLPKPYEFLSDVIALEFDNIIVDRTSFLRSGRNRLTVEQVPEWIYKASYPSWFLSEKQFLACFHKNYRLIAEFPALDKLHPEGEAADYKGFIFELKR